MFISGVIVLFTPLTFRTFRLVSHGRWQVLFLRQQLLKAVEVYTEGHRRGWRLYLSLLWQQRSIK